MESLKINLLSIAAAIVYGIVHDQITARICVEYFTIGHAPIFGTDDPTLLGIGWGILATWWVGLLLGVPLAAIARAGQLPKRSAASLVRPITVLMLVSACGAAVAGLIGWKLATERIVTLEGLLGANVPKDKHVAFLIDGFAHTASYAFGLLGGLVVMALIWRSRLTLTSPSVAPPSVDNGCSWT